MSKITDTLGAIGEGLMADPILILIIVLIIAKFAGVF